MSDKERLQLENELLMTCSKAQAINKYIDELNENCKLSELWCKSQQENEQLQNNWNELLNWLESKNKIILQQHNIVEPIIKIQEVIDKIKESE